MNISKNYINFIYYSLNSLFVISNDLSHIIQYHFVKKQSTSLPRNDSCSSQRSNLELLVHTGGHRVSRPCIWVSCWVSFCGRPCALCPGKYHSHLQSPPLCPRRGLESCIVIPLNLLTASDPVLTSESQRGATCVVARNVFLSLINGTN